MAATQLATLSQGVPPATLVGQVTVVSGCRWASVAGVAASTDLAAVFLGRKFTLESGLLEIVYKSGWQVILQGPATFEVNAEDGGFLSRGKLTARLDRAASGINVQGSGASRRLILHPSSLNLLPAPPAPAPNPLPPCAAHLPRPRSPARPASWASRSASPRLAGYASSRVRPSCVSMAAAKRGQAPFAGTARRVLRTNGACPLFVLCENQSAETVQLGDEQIVRPVSQPEFAAGFARRILRVVFPKMPRPDEQLAGAWPKSMGPEITEGRLIAIGSGKDIEPSAGVAGRKGPNRRCAAAVSGATVAVAPISRPANYSRSTTWP